MIVSSQHDAVILRGALQKNEWLTINALAKLLLQQHPQGILVDCTGLTEVSTEGAKTFLDAMRDIEAEGARIIVVNIPEDVLQIIRSVPGIRSQLPIARSTDEARASLRLSATATMAESDPDHPDNPILVPLIDGLDTEHAIVIAARLARETRLPVMLVSLLEVARNLPIGAPLGELEEAAHARLERAIPYAASLNLKPVRLLERVRGVDEGLLQVIKSHRASHVVASVAAEHIDEEWITALIDLLLRRAPCGVIIARKAVEE